MISRNLPLPLRLETNNSHNIPSLDSSSSSLSHSPSSPLMIKTPPPWLAIDSPSENHSNHSNHSNQVSPPSSPLSKEIILPSKFRWTRPLHPSVSSTFPTPPPSPDPHERSLTPPSELPSPMKCSSGLLLPQIASSPSCESLSSLLSNDLPLEKDSLPTTMIRSRRSSFQDALNLPSRFISHGHKESLAIRNKPVKKSIPLIPKDKMAFSRTLLYYLGPMIIAILSTLFIAQDHLVNSSPHHVRYYSEAYVASFSSHDLDFVHPFVSKKEDQKVSNSFTTQSSLNSVSSQDSHSEIIDYENYFPNHSSFSDRSNPSNLINRDKIYLYRILGNDLPPRHQPGQTLTNLKFLLENEGDFPNTIKVFVVNRIVDETYEKAIISLLKEYQKPFIRIPFDLDEYAKQDFKLDGFPIDNFFQSQEFADFPKMSKLRTIDYTYHNKNLYAMNNNGGRNVALSHGKRQLDAQWILPFDGNCFFTPNAFAHMITRLLEDSNPYVIVPMARLLDNQHVFRSNDIRPNAFEEPQVAFRYDSTEFYRNDMRYGRRSKLELLWRLGAIPKDRGLDVSTVPWEDLAMQIGDWASANSSFSSAGWVFRLFSGHIQQEENTLEAHALRSYNRLIAIQYFLHKLDEKVAIRKGFGPKRLFAFESKELESLSFRD